MPIAKGALQRMASATKWVEGYSRPGAGLDGNSRLSADYCWWGITKERINNGDSGEVYAVTGSAIAPTEGTDFYTVANPVMGDLLDGMRVLVVPAIVRDRSTDEVWHVAPFELMYEAKAAGTIAAGASGTWRVWHDTDSGQDITAHLRWVPASRSASSGQQARIKWDLFKQRFYVDSMDC